MVKLRCLIMALALTVALAGCGEGSSGETVAPREDVRELRVTLDGLVGAPNVGILIADAYGYFRDAGLDLTLSDPVLPVRPLPYVVGRSTEISVSHLPEVVLAQQKGDPVIAVGSVVPETTAAFIWLPEAKIDGIADLEGKTIAIPGLPFQERFLQNLLARAGLTLADVKIEDVGYDLVPALTRGRADAIFGGSWNVEGAELRAQGLRPVITRLQSLGVPSYEELVLIVRPDRLAKDPESIRDFIAAMDRGTAEALRDPEVAAEIVAYEEGKSLSPETKAEFEATLPLLSESGQMSEEKASQLVDWMYEQDMIKRKPSASELFTNEYLPQP